MNKYSTTSVLIDDEEWETVWEGEFVPIYTCTHCYSNGIERHHDYCPFCGHKIVWY